MRIDILTLFPQMFDGVFSQSIIKRAVERELVSILLHNIRDYAYDRHHVVDDYPYGGGAGMVLKPEPIFEAVERIRAETHSENGEDAGDSPPIPTILLTPQGRPFCQGIAQELSQYNHLLLICGRYEGVDERVCEHLVSEELSIGDYVLGGGELAAMVVVDAVIRLLPGVLGSETSAVDDSYTKGLLEYPHYTRPQVYRGWSVPDVLLSGNHGEIAKWRREQAILRTIKRRPDLLEPTILPKEEIELVNKVKRLNCMECY